MPISGEPEIDGRNPPCAARRGTRWARFAQPTLRV